MTSEGYGAEPVRGLYCLLLLQTWNCFFPLVKKSILKYVTHVSGLWTCVRYPPFRQWPQLQHGMAKKGQSAFKSTCWQHPVKASRESSFPEDSVSEKGLVRGRESLSWQAAPLWTPLLYLLISSTCPKTAHPESGGLRCKAKLHNLIFLLGKTYGSTKTNMHLYLWAICQNAARVVIIGPTMVIMLLLRKK